eukprot:scaffold43964_cov53-Attheya_sp.AAC.1
MAMMQKRTLLFVGTYGEKLGHVDGKGEGVYVLSYEESSRRLVYESPFFGRSQLGVKDGGPLLNPTYLCSYRGDDGDLFLYIVDERCHGDVGGFVMSARVNEETGELTQHGNIVLASPDPAGGMGTCHVSVAPGGRHVFIANYGGGSVAAVERHIDGTLGARTSYIRLPPPSPAGIISFPGPNPARQEASHAHMVHVLPKAKEDGSFTALVPDLGSDTVWSMNYNATIVDDPLRLTMPPLQTHPILSGGGPRHLALHPSKPIVYVAFELTSQIAAFSINPSTGSITGPPLPPGPVNSLDVRNLPSNTSRSQLAHPFCDMSTDDDDDSVLNRYAKLLMVDESTGACICSDEHTSLAACRIVDGPGALTALKLQTDGTLSVPAKGTIGITSTLGVAPRDFILLRTASGSLVAIVANQDSTGPYKMVDISCGGDNNDIPIDLDTPVPTPVCICVVPEKT